MAREGRCLLEGDAGGGLQELPCVSVGDAQRDEIAMQIEDPFMPDAEGRQPQVEQLERCRPLGHAIAVMRFTRCRPTLGSCRDSVPASVSSPCSAADSSATSSAAGA